MILQHLLRMSNLHDVYIKFVCKIRMYLIPGKYELAASGYKSPLLVHKIAFPGAYLSKNNAIPYVSKSLLFIVSLQDIAGEKCCDD